MDWVSVKDRLPNEEERKRSRCLDFLCNVMIPQIGGGYEECYKVIRYRILDNMWECDGMIVTHWANIEPPNGNMFRQRGIKVES